MSSPTVFISYSHDSEDHKAWVLQLAIDLRKKGVDATIDQWDLVPGQDVSAFMQKGIIASKRVLMICSDNYVTKAEAGTGGVGFERLVLTAEIVQSIDTKKFIPLIRNNKGTVKIPRFLGPRLYIDLSDDASYENKFEDLLRELLGAQRRVKPPLGANPFSGQVSKPGEPVRMPGPTGITQAGAPILDDEWFEHERTTAEKGIASLGLLAHMELRFGLHAGTNKSQVELVNAIRTSQIATFDWPIGVTLDNPDEYRPRPYKDGVRAEISIGQAIPSRRPSYDYWAARKNGDFFLLQSLFEDQRVVNEIFFNTRIVRVTESLLFASNLYDNLGVPPETRLSIRVSHRGLSGRTLTSSSSTRLLMSSRVTHESESQAEVVVALGSIREALVEEVQRITAPLFMLFDFQKFEMPIYTDIVKRFERGEVS